MRRPPPPPQEKPPAPPPAADEPVIAGELEMEAPAGAEPEEIVLLDEDEDEPM
jgi:hypothetical protein